MTKFNRSTVDQGSEKPGFF